MPGWVSSGWGLAGLVVAGGLLLLAVYDLTQRSRAVLRAFPIIGHLRYLLIEIGPEIRQYLIADNKEELPFNRNERSWIERSAERKNNYFGFGTDEQVYGIGYPIIDKKQYAPGMTPRFKPLAGRDDHLLGSVAARLAGRGTAAAN